MMVGLILAAEVAFWVVLASGLAVRYLLRMRRLGGVLLMGVPLIDVLLLTATAIDLRGGGEMSAGHGLAVLYLGFTVGYGHYLVTWADGHAAHRLGGAARPAKPPRYGMARARHEWRLWRMTLVSVLIAVVVAQLLRWFISEPEADRGMVAVQFAALRVLGIHTLIAAAYTIWPKRPKRPKQAERTDESALSEIAGGFVESGGGSPRAGRPSAGAFPPRAADAARGVGRSQWPVGDAEFGGSAGAQPGVWRRSDAGGGG
ncbi:hypothetical protein [Streptomyces triticirhizae]|uniref:hypothetical protein n=1 Tax=Streptomyces triticirhizae TaxID=2483353 RepID=UPI001F3E37EA|nr:hypothetical protein [Streptomyces triticirhizae]